MNLDPISHAHAGFLRPGLDRKLSYVEFEPAPALREDLEYCWLMAATEPLPSPLVTRSPGKGSVDLIVPLEGHFCEQGERHLFGAGRIGAYLVGPLSRPAAVTSTGACTAVGMRFRPGRSRAYFHFPTHELSNGLLAIEAAAPRLARELNTITNGTGGISKAFSDALQRSLLGMRKVEYSVTAATRALELISSCHGGIHVDDVAERTGIGVRQLERTFRESVGLSPKQICRIARVRRAAELISGGSVSWTAVAYASGYCDQAHFIHEFRAIMGVAPSMFMKERKRPCSAG